MNGFELIAKTLKAEGVEWIACYPSNPLIEAAADVVVVSDGTYGYLKSDFRIPGHSQ